MEPGGGCIPVALFFIFWFTSECTDESITFQPQTAADVCNRRNHGKNHAQITHCWIPKAERLILAAVFTNSFFSSFFLTKKKQTNLCKLIGRPCVWIVWYWRQLGSRDLLTCTSIETLRSAGCTGHWNSFISYKALEVEAVKRLNVHKKPLHGRSVLETWKKF